MKDRASQNLVKSVRQAERIRHGSMKPSRTFKLSPADIKSIRLKLSKSQSEFTLMIGVSFATLQNWEQDRRTPKGQAGDLLKVATENPGAVVEALSA